MTPYQITINWEWDFMLEQAIKLRYNTLLDRAKYFKKRGHSIKSDLSQLRECISILKQIRAHKDLSTWKH